MEKHLHWEGSSKGAVLYYMSIDVNERNVVDH